MIDKSTWGDGPWLDEPDKVLWNYHNRLPVLRRIQEKTMNKFKIIYSNQSPLSEKTQNSIFLAGPTPREISIPSWRPEALRILNDLDYKGIVCIPEPNYSDWSSVNYLNQVDWEYICLSNVEKICFWVPRDMNGMPALTTNVEFGYWLATSPERIVYGRPDNAVHCGYLDWLYTKLTDRRPFFKDLQKMLESICENS